MAKESPEEKLTALIEGILDSREQRQKEAANPSLRGQRLAERLEKWLDAQEAKEAKPKEKADDKGDDKILGGIFG